MTKSPSGYSKSTRSARDANPKLTKTEREQFAIQTAKRFYESVNSPISLSCWILANEGEYEQLVKKSVNPLHYLASENDRFSMDYQCVSLLSKAMLDTGIDTTKVALEKWLAAEEMCLYVNNSWDERRKMLGSVLLTASKLISDVLGRVPDVAKLAYRFGPGATRGVGGNLVSLDNKISPPFGGIQCTKASVPYILKHLSGVPLLMSKKLGIEDVEAPFTPLVSMKVNLCEANRLTFVPKSAKTDRAIAVEAHDMVPTQLALGGCIRSRLWQKAGIDLNRQDQTNAKLALKGSINGDYATIDLSSASDTISYRLVQDLVPPDWFELLSALRHDWTQLPDQSFHLNQKFSSMGNGFTFELETLLFWAIAKAVVLRRGGLMGSHVYSFGDDIIVPSEYATEVCTVLEDCGFSLNHDKTFIDGVFRESCGHDYFNGHQVRPFFLKNDQESLQYATDKFKVANALRVTASRSINSNRHSWANARPSGNVSKGVNLDFADPRFYETWRYVVNSIPKRLRCYGPFHVYDDAIWVPTAEIGTTLLPERSVYRDISADGVQRGQAISQMSRSRRWEDATPISLKRFVGPRQPTLQKTIYIESTSAKLLDSEMTKRIIAVYGGGPELVIRGSRYPKTRLVHLVHWDRDFGRWLN